MVTAIVSERKSLQSATPVSSIPQWSRLKPLLPIEIGLPGRSAAGRQPPPTQKTPSRSAQADCWPKAFMPIEIGLSGRCAPGVGLRRRKRHLPGRRRPTAGRRPPQAEFIRRAGRPLAEGPGRPNSFGAHADRRPKAFMPIEIGLPGRSRARRRPSPTQKAPPGRRRPTVGRRPLEAEFIRHTGRPPAEGLHAD